MKIKIFAISIISLLILLLAGCNIVDIERLSATLDNYYISATYHPEDNTLSGAMSLDYTNKSDNGIDNILFNVYANAYSEGQPCPISPENISEAYIKGMSYGSCKISEVKVNDNISEWNSTDIATIISIPLGTELFFNSSVNIDIVFTVNLPNVSHRMGYTENSINLGQFFPSVCYSENGAFLTYPYYSSGDPFVSEVANYNVTFTAPENFHIAYTGELVSKETTDNKCIKYNYKAICVRDFALVLSNKFQIKESICEDINLKYYYIDDDKADESLAIIEKCFTLFNKLFGKYPYKTFCAAQTDFCYGGMEYPNLIYIATKLDRNSHNKVIIHEIAHQWWYGVVGNNQVTNAWMDEGLAEYSVMLFYENYPEYGNSKELLKTSYKKYKLYFDVLKHYDKQFDTSLTRSIPEYPNNQTYVCLNYLKSMLLFDNLRSVMGNKKFMAGLKRYYKSAQFKVATPDTLIYCFEKEFGAPLTEWFDSWLGNDTIIG